MIATTDAWNWQQGAMATWFDDDHIAFNEISKRRASLVSIL